MHYLRARSTYYKSAKSAVSRIIVAEQDVSLPTVLLIQQLKCVDLDPIVNVNSYGTNPIGQRNDKIFLNTIRKH